MSEICADPATDARTYREAADANREDPLRSGSLLEFPNYGQVVMTGDLHGHHRNLERLQTFCDLEHRPVRHIILHEIVHQDLGFSTGVDQSHEVLLEAARWKCAYPDQVHCLFGNHELAQLTGREISKGGRSLTSDFARGVEQTYGPTGAPQVMEAITEFLGSFALAARTPNRVFLSHSLPGRYECDRFDPEVLTRPLDATDITEGGSAYALVWGRRQGPELLDRLADMLDVDLFICGHQPQEDGYVVIDDRLLIIASDHNHGVFVPVELCKPLTMPDLVRAIRPLASIA